MIHKSIGCLVKDVLNLSCVFTQVLGMLEDRFGPVFTAFCVVTSVFNSFVSGIVKIHLRSIGLDLPGQSEGVENGGVTAEKKLGKFWPLSFINTVVRECRHRYLSQILSKKLDREERLNKQEPKQMKKKKKKIVAIRNQLQRGNLQIQRTSQ